MRKSNVKFNILKNHYEGWLNKIIFINLVIATFLYIFLFVIYPQNSNYFECNQTVQNNFLNSQISYSIPVSCDQELYLVGVYDFQAIYTFDYNYQSRPLYILTVKIFFDILNILLKNTLIVKFLSFCLTHIIIISFATKFLFDALENARVTINNKSKFFLSVFMLLTPIIKWGLFDSSHQTLTFLQFTISFYFLVRKYEEFSKVYLLSFILGFLALSNLTFFLPHFFLIFHKINSVDKIFDNARKLFFTSILFLTPILAWNIFIRSQGYVPYNSATTYWNQFIWVKDFIVSRYENVNLDSRYEYYCMSIPIFLNCYLSDFSKSLLYLFNLLVLILSTYHFIGNREKALYIALLKKLSTVFLVSFVFWSFIGWYPPLRFSLYSLGAF